MNNKLILIIPVLCFSFSFTEWDFHSEKEGIKLFHREEEGNPLKTSRCLMELRNTDFDRIKSVFLDVQGHSQWIYGAKEVRLLEESENQFTVYYVIDAPWPVSDRDLILEYTFSYEGDNIMRVDALSSYEDLPEYKDYVRIKMSESNWTFNLGSNGAIELENISMNHPGGSIPAWLANMSSNETPFHTMINFRKAVAGED